MNDRPPQRSAYTLFEVIVALGLSVIVLAAIGFAVDLHLRTLQSRRSRVEEAQLARAVLRLMADDLRNAVQYKAIDFSSVEKLATGNSSTIEEELGEEQPIEEEAQSLADSVAPPTIPGLYGNQFELRVDISRLPRVDQYDPSLVAESVSVTDIPSDVKTVAYYLIADSTTTEFQSATLDGDDSTRQTGLVRRVLDRAVTQWAADNGSLSSIDSSGEIVAPEVVYLEFRFFDGSEWVIEWDSDELGGLPIAVEIGLGIAPSNANVQTAPTPSSHDESTQQEMSFYRLVVHLPASEIIEDSAVDESSGEESDL